MAMATQKTPAKSTSKAATSAAKPAAKPSKPVKLATKITQALFGGKKTAASATKASSAKGKAPAPVAPPAKAAVAAKAPVAGKAPVKAAPAKGKGRGRQKFAGVQTTLAGVALFGTAHVESTGLETVCREVACEGLATSAGYCRMHYIKNWKKIRRKAVILQEGKLNQYIEELVAKYPDKYIEAILQDLSNDKDFAKVIYDLDLDESEDDFEAEGDDVEAVIDTVKRDFEEDSGDTGF